MNALLSEIKQNNLREIIIQAGKQTMTYSKQVIGQKYKEGASIVTQADIATENFLRERLGKILPLAGFYSEETFKESADELNKELIWVVDPIDGTLNFSRGLEIYGISVALFQNQKPIFGAIYLPCFKEYYWAIKDNGAFCNKNQISVQQHDNLFGVCGRGTDFLQNSKFNKLLLSSNLEVASTYCTVYNFAHTARGRFDFAMSDNAALWDIAAAWLLIEEAGGMFKIFQEDKQRLFTRDQYYLSCIGGHQSVVEKIAAEIIK